MSKVLLVDGDAELRDRVAPVLARRHRVIEAASGEAASAAALVHELDLIIIDGALPDAGGAAWLEALREIGDPTPVIFVAGARRDPALERRLVDDLDVALIVYKPLDPEVFGALTALAAREDGAGAARPRRLRLLRRRLR